MDPRIIALEKSRYRPPRPPKKKPPNGFIPFLLILLLLAAAALHARQSHAGVFDLPSFLEAGQWSFGVEPEVIISNGTGAGINFKPRFGVNNNLNWQAIIGTGTGSRKFRIGAIADFEWFPDHEKQPGIATPFMVKYSRVDDDGVLAIGVMPLLYKSFDGEGGRYTPFISFPIGWDMRSAKVTGFTQVALGSLFKLPTMEKFKYVLEAGFNIHQSHSYISGGFTYYP